MYYDKDFFDWYKTEFLNPPQVWTELQTARKQQMEARLYSVETLLQKTDAKFERTKKKLRATTKALADCQTRLIQRQRQLCVCKIKTLQVPVK
jgi:hypothetical protein